MEPADERLKKALEAGNILVTEKALATLSEWVDKVGPVTFLMAKWIRTSKSRTDLKKELSELCKALQSTVDILNRDGGRLAAFLFNEVSSDSGAKNEREAGEDANRQVSSVSVSLYSTDAGQRLIEWPSDLLIKAQASLKRLRAVKNRRGAPEHENTWFLHSVRILYGKLTGTRDPAIGQRFHRFAKAFAELIGEAGLVPESEDVFKKRFRTPRKHRSKRSGVQTRGSPSNI